MEPHRFPDARVSGRPIWGKLGKTIPLSQAEVAFSDIWAIASMGHTLTPEDVQGWQMICRRPL
jgi:hypothetical protein